MTSFFTQAQGFRGAIWTPIVRLSLLIAALAGPVIWFLLQVLLVIWPFLARFR
jgi:hypothetical protein